MKLVLKYILVLFFACIFVPVFGQSFPDEGRNLNYRIIGFSFPERSDAHNYRVDVALGKYSDEVSFKKHLLKYQQGKTNKIVTEVPHFGRAYTWRVVYLLGNKEISKSGFHHFTTGRIPELDKSRLRIELPSTAYKDNYVFVDGTRVMFNMEGKVVWYLPDVDKDKETIEQDIKLTTRGTITFIKGSNAYEIDYNGNVLWKGPRTESTTGGVTDSPGYMYHHEFTRLKSGHYMALISAVDQRMKSLPTAGIPEPLTKSTRRFFPDMQDGRIAEFDANGNMVWDWHTSKYFNESDLYPLCLQNPDCHIDFHENSFYFDDKDSIIYLSMMGLSRVLKISYPSGKVIGTYGNLYAAKDTGSKKDGPIDMRITLHDLAQNDMYCRQHSCVRTRDGYLYVYNNNIETIPLKAPVLRHAQVVKLKETNGTNNLEKIWSYNCVTENELQPATAGGGNIIELNDGSLFVSTNAPYSKIFILNGIRKEQWRAYAEKWNDYEKKWMRASQYRASIVQGPNELHRLIFNAK